VLQEGRARRRAAILRARRRRRRRLALGVVLVIVTLAALLVVVTGHTADPGQTTLRHLAGRATAPTTRPRPHTAEKPTYGVALAPATDRVRPRTTFHVGSGILFDVWTGRVLWEKNAGRRVPIASLTKMMTALLVAERTKPTDRVLVTREAVHFTGSGVGLLPLGHHVEALALLYGLLLPSGNDAAIALAQHVAGSQRAFVGLMNAEARRMRLTCTHFTTVSGVLDKDNYSCTTDLAVLAHAVLEQPLLSRVVATRDAIVPFPIKGGKLYLYNNNPLLRLRFPGADGVKTGYTRAAGPCLVATARRGNTWLGVVLLNGSDTSGEAQKLLNAGFGRLRKHPGPVASS
jgi:D-alanyl-D-alanine carboxypeptidase